MNSRVVLKAGSWLIASTLWGLAYSASTPLGADPEAMPAGTARDLLFTACVGCHTLDTVTEVTKSRAEWETTIYDMMSRGAQIFPDEVDTLVRYLDENLSVGKADPAKTGQ